jgi:hypothetical protein
MNLDALVSAAQTHCQSLEAAVHKETALLAEVDTTLHHLSSQLAAQTEQWQGALGEARGQSQRLEQSNRDRAARLTAHFEDTKTQVERLETQLAADLESMPGALAQLREQATQAAPRLAETAQLVHTRLEEMNRQVDQLLGQLSQELEDLEREVRAFQEGTLEQRQALEKQLAACLESAENLHGEGRAASQSLGQAVGSAGKDLEGLLAGTELSLQEGGRTAHARLLESQQELSQQMSRDAQQILQSVESLHSACQQSGQQAVDQSMALHGSLGDLCRALEPLVQVQQLAKKTGAMECL